MSLVGRHYHNHPQAPLRHKPEVDERGTPWSEFDPIDVEFGFTIDVATTRDWAKCKRFFTIEDDGLVQSWDGERVWCNPPYSQIRPWVEKACGETAELIVMLLPANRTEQAWWQDLIEPRRMSGEIEVRFLRGRRRMLMPGCDEILPNQRPPFGHCLVIWR